jgi:hypothetical protein
MKGDSIMASATKLNEQSDPVCTCNAVALCSDDVQLPGGSELENQDTTASSLIENWIDA